MVADQTEHSWVIAHWLSGIEIHYNSLLLLGTQSSLSFRETEHIARLIEKLVFGLKILWVVDHEHPADHLPQPS